MLLAFSWLGACSHASRKADALSEGEPELVAGDAGSGGGTQLDNLREQRLKDESSNRLSIGPGDEIEITVAGVPELDKFKVRVSEDNAISLPLVGNVPVAGLTEEELRETLHGRLEKPVKNPQVEVFVDQYYSREVAVVGLVQKPGLYNITSRTDTILDMIGRAGGMTENASSLVLLIPASSSAKTTDRLALVKALSAPAKELRGQTDSAASNSGPAERQLADKPDRIDPVHDENGQLADHATAQSRLLSLVAASAPIQIDLTSGGRDGALSLPVRAGDMIVVPSAGEVMVDGWVQNPGAFRIVPGMTALSAISAAGGALFSHTAEVLRSNSDGGRSAIPINLTRVKSGQDPDVPIQGSDVVWVNRSVIGAVPYSLYEVFTRFGTGMVIPAP